MVFLIGGLILLIAFLLSYIFYMKKEMLNIANQLNDYNNFKTEKNIDVNLINREVEALAESINKHIEIANDLRLKEVKSKEGLKEMIANISHDLRTPLTSIVGYIQMVRLKSNLDDKSMEYLSKVERKGRDLEIMLDDFFTLSIAESTDYNLCLEYIDLNEILCDTIVEFYSELEKRNIEPKISLEEVEKIIGDKKSIVRIIENLMSNTLKYSSKDLAIELRQGKDRVSLIFMNSLEKDVNIDIERLFDKFYKNNDKIRTNKSTGLGLAIVKSLMEKMNGEVTANNVDNKLYVICTWSIV